MICEPSHSTDTNIINKPTGQRILLVARALSTTLSLIEARRLIDRLELLMMSSMSSSVAMSAAAGDFDVPHGASAYTRAAAETSASVGGCASGVVLMAISLPVSASVMMTAGMLTIIPVEMARSVLMSVWVIIAASVLAARPLRIAASVMVVDASMLKAGRQRIPVLTSKAASSVSRRTCGFWNWNQSTLPLTRVGAPVRSTVVSVVIQRQAFRYFALTTPHDE